MLSQHLAIIKGKFNEGELEGPSNKAERGGHWRVSPCDLGSNIALNESQRVRLKAQTKAYAAGFIIEILPNGVLRI
jgi:hypothetical protein